MNIFMICVRQIGPTLFFVYLFILIAHTTIHRCYLSYLPKQQTVHFVVLSLRCIVITDISLISKLVHNIENREEQGLCSVSQHHPFELSNNMYKA